MFITYAPADGAPQSWDFDSNDIPSSAAEVIERRFGENFEVWQAGVQSGNMRARRVLLWYLLWRQHPSLRYEDTPDFTVKEVKIEWTVAELTEIREVTMQRSMPEDKRERALSAIDYELTKAMDREQAKADAQAAESAGKAGSLISETSGGTPLPLS